MLVALVVALVATNARLGSAQHFPTNEGLEEYIESVNCSSGEKEVGLREGLLSSPLTELLNLTSIGPAPVTKECYLDLIDGEDEDKEMAQPSVLPLRNRNRNHRLTTQEKGGRNGDGVFDGLEEIYYIKPGELFPSWNCDKHAQGLSRCTDLKENTNITRGYALSFIPNARCEPVANEDNNWAVRSSFRSSFRSSSNSSQERTCIKKILFVHGGGWWYGSPSTASYAPFAARLAESTCLPVLSMDYSLTVGADAPSILKQVEKTLQWMSTHDERGNPYPEDVKVEVIIAGDSSGGGTSMSTLVANQESKKGSPSPSWWTNESEKDGAPWFNTGNAELVGGILFSPFLNLKANTPTYFSNRPCTKSLTKATNGCPLKGEEALPQYNVITGDLTYGMDWLPLEGEVLPSVEYDEYGSLLYLGNDSSLLSEPIFNIDAGTDFTGIPNVQIHVSLSEVLAAESSILSDQLPESELHMYDGMWHVFPMYFSGCNRSKPNQHLLFAESVFKLVSRFATKGLGRRGTTTHYEYPWGHDTGMVGF